MSCACTWTLLLKVEFVVLCYYYFFCFFVSFVLSKKSFFFFTVLFFWQIHKYRVYHRIICWSHLLNTNSKLTSLLQTLFCNSGSGNIPLACFKFRCFRQKTTTNQFFTTTTPNTRIYALSNKEEKKERRTTLLNNRTKNRTKRRL